MRIVLLLLNVVFATLGFGAYFLLAGTGYNLALAVINTAFAAVLAFQLFEERA